MKKEEGKGKVADADTLVHVSLRVLSFFKMCFDGLNEEVPDAVCLKNVRSMETFLYTS